MELTSPLLILSTQQCADPEYYNAFLSIRNCTVDQNTTIPVYKGVGSQYQVYVDNIEDFDVCEVKVDGGCADECLPAEPLDISSVPEANSFYNPDRLLRISQV